MDVGSWKVIRWLELYSVVTAVAAVDTEGPALAVAGLIVIVSLAGGMGPAREAKASDVEKVSAWLCGCGRRRGCQRDRLLEVGRRNRCLGVSLRNTRRNCRHEAEHSAPGHRGLRRSHHGRPLLGGCITRR